MGSRKRITAEKIKEARKQMSFAKLRNCPSSPRKMRLVADMVRGVDVDKALDILKYSSKQASRDIQKLLLSAVANWQVKNEGERVEEANLFVKEIYVDEGKMLKRLRPAPQGRGNRIRKRSNHVTLVVDKKGVTETENA